MISTQENTIDLFPDFSENSKVWIFQSEMLLDENQQKTIHNSWNSFAPSWNAHGKAIKSQVQILHKCFIIVCLDENVTQASGCSIDKLMHFIQVLEHNLNCSLLNRTNIAYRNNEDCIEICTLDNAKKLYENNIINDQTMVYNNVVTNIAELKKSWEIPLNKSWLKNFL